MGNNVNRSIQETRNILIRKIDENKNINMSKKYADALFDLDLTVYSKDYTIESLIYNSFAQSSLDENINLHPEQVNIVNLIRKNDAIIVSAPTSFGKTYSVFEYIASEKPDNIVLIVPTLALVEEYMRKIIKKYSSFFKIYKVHTQLSTDDDYKKNKKNLFILTHDKVVKSDINSIFESIDFLVIDEVYQLAKNSSNDRVLILNMAYYYLSKIAKKYVLLAPFIKNVEDLDELEKKPLFFNTNYSPVVNDISVIDVNDDYESRYIKSEEILSENCKDDKTLIYFPTVFNSYEYINKIVYKKTILEISDMNIYNFINWLKEEYHSDWSIVKALERGYVVHNGQIPRGIRNYLLSLYETNKNYNRLICTSTLLEGVNTCAKNLIIVKPCRKSSIDYFSAFDFYNLVGRTGRLNQHLIGKAYYLKSNNDPEYSKNDAIKSIRFELTDDSVDIDIQKSEIADHERYKTFLNKLKISHEDYLEHIGSHFRFETILDMHLRYSNNKKELLKVFDNYKRLDLIKVLYVIFEGSPNKYQCFLINTIISYNRLTVRNVIENIKDYYKDVSIDKKISDIVKLKTSYIEHNFYNKLLIIKYFLELDDLIKGATIIQENIIKIIEFMYFNDSKQKKMLYEIGIHEKNIDHIIKVIGTNFKDVFEMKKLLKNNYDNFRGLNFISKYIINSL